MEGFNTEVLSVQGLVYGGVVDLVEENRISARRWARLVALHERAPDPVETALPGWGPMQPREWTAGEVGAAWAFGDQHVRSEVNTALFIAEHLPDVWQMWSVVAARIVVFLRKHLRSYPECGPELNIQMVTCTVVQLRNRMNYEIRRILADDEEFQRQYADRKVSVYAGDDGIAQLSVTGTVDQVMLARQRLHLSAKAVRAAGDERTIEQLMADLALDLIIGKADGVPVPAYARPIRSGATSWQLTPRATTRRATDRPSSASSITRSRGRQGRRTRRTCIRCAVGTTRLSTSLLRGLTWSGSTGTRARTH